MISFYSGTPGSGKSLEAAKEVCFWLKTLKKNVIANVLYDRKYILRGASGGRFFYLDNLRFTPDFFEKYALKYHKIGSESQSLIVIDEAQLLFSPTAVKMFSEVEPDINFECCHKCKKFGKDECKGRDCGKLPVLPYRQNWLEFFSQHRHLGYDILIISQFDRLIDAQIRCMFEYNCIHRKINNFRVFGQLLTIFHIKFFCQVNYWYGVNAQTSKKFFMYRKKYSRIYDSFGYRDKILSKLTKKYGEDFVFRLTHNAAEYKAYLESKKVDPAVSDKKDSLDVVNL